MEKFIDDLLHRFSGQMVIDKLVNAFFSKLSLLDINKLFDTRSWDPFCSWFLMLYVSWACEKCCLFH